MAWMEGQGMSEGSRHGILVAGVQSRSGKTTVTLALMAALRQAGETVAAFKAGPDFIDPTWHQQVTGEPSFNLDTFMVGVEESRALLWELGAKGFVVVEGVMGLFDGREGVGGPGSSADLARQLGLPVVLVVDGHGMAGSIAPLVDGFVRHGQGFAITGVVATRLGGQSHAERLAHALASCQLPPLLAWLPRDEGLTLPERHLGLVMAGETGVLDSGAWAGKLHLDLAALRQAARMDPLPAPWPVEDTPLLPGLTVAVARDAAFCFLYPANLRWLYRMGARVRFFSPLAGDRLPAEARAVWLPGGYPELHGSILARSPTWQSLGELVTGGGAVLAECGGMMALGESLTDLQGQTWPMARVLPIHTRMTPRLAGLGYRWEAQGARGHEFHHSVREVCDLPPAFEVTRGDGGIRLAGVRASYIHWYFPSAPTVCAGWFQGLNATGTS